MRYIFTLLFFIGISCFAQKAEEPLNFLGRPIAGSSETFIKFLEDKGFSQTDSFESSTSFIGKFANEFVKLKLLYSPKTKTVCKIIISFSEKDNWDELKEDYFKKKNLYKSKYLLTDEFEFFLDPYDEGDGYEMSAVARDKCRFVCFFKEFGGHIGLEINQKGCVQVSYEDDINIQVAKKEFESKAFDDI